MALLGFGAAPMARAEPVCRVVGSADPPFRVFAANGQVTGLYFELLKELSRRAGWSLAFLEAPAARALAMVRDGEADLMIGLLRTPEREAYLQYSRITLPPENKAIYTRSRRLVELAELRGLRVGLHRGKRYGVVFDTLEGVERVWLQDYASALRMLSLGRLDAVIAPERQGDQLVQQLALRTLKKQPLQLKGEVPHLAVALHSPWASRLVELERAYDGMLRDGSWNRLLGA